MPGTWEHDRNEREKEFERAFGKRTARKQEKTSREAMKQIAEWEREHWVEAYPPAAPVVDVEKKGCLSPAALIMLSLVLLAWVIL